MEPKQSKKPLLIALAIGALIFYGSSNKSSPAPIEKEHSPTYAVFKAGDVVEIDAPGLMCWGSEDGTDGLHSLVDAILYSPRKNWPHELKLYYYCGDLETYYPYEIMEANPAGVEPYPHVYCVNSVHGFPTNKSGCVWAVFPADHARLSSCKADPALVLDPNAKKVEEPDPGMDVGHHPDPHLPCQDHQ